MVLAAATYKQQATYWGSPTQGGFGGITYGAPRVILCRWEDRIETFTTLEGSERRSKSIVYTMEELEIGGFLAEGDHTAEPDPTNLSGVALEIQRADDVPDLRGLNHTYRNFL